MKQKIPFEKSYFCSRCGKRLPRKLNKCPDCGFLRYTNNPYPNVSAVGAGGLGWSDKIKDPLFAKYQSNARKNIFIWCTALAILIPGTLFAFGQIRFNSEGVMVAAVIVGMFFLIGIFSALNTLRHGKSWEGVVENKRIEKHSKKVKNNDGTTSVKQFDEYVLTVRLSDGKIKEKTDLDDDRYYGYFNIGDRIRNHQSRNVKYLEKYDKSQDEIVYCAACAYLNDIRGNYCQACGCPLLK